MAETTPKELRSQVVYSVFVRNFSPEGTFAGVERELGRIRALGTDIVWLMPIHPIGRAKRKGTLGSPYAIADYRAVNPEYGTQADFERLVRAIHAHGMKCMIDVVYNHTSPDSWLAQNHPEWFYRRPDGGFGNKNGDWSDIIDLDYTQPALWDYQIETLCRWAGLVDGFRCDVAPLVPLAFWRAARAAVEKVRPGCLWLSESVEPGYVLENRRRGIGCLSDGEIYTVFDAAYDYDVYGTFLAALCGEQPLSAYADALCRQEYTYPDNYVKLRFLENHDQRRAAFLIPDARALRSWTAFQFFCKGMALVYNGQERSALCRPDLFERDPVDWSGEDLSPLLARLAEIRRDPIFCEGAFEVHAAAGGLLSAQYETPDGRRLAGVFSTRGTAGLLRVGLPDGRYENRIDGTAAVVENGLVRCAGQPMIFG